MGLYATPHGKGIATMITRTIRAARAMLAELAADVAWLRRELAADCAAVLAELTADMRAAR